jgi:hypothetical protein
VKLVTLIEVGVTLRQCMYFNWREQFGYLVQCLKWRLPGAQNWSLSSISPGNVVFSTPYTWLCTSQWSRVILRGLSREFCLLVPRHNISRKASSERTTWKTLVQKEEWYKMDLKVTGFLCLRIWIGCRVNTVMNLRIIEEVGNSATSWANVSLSEGMELVTYCPYSEVCVDPETRKISLSLTHPEIRDIVTGQWPQTIRLVVAFRRPSTSVSVCTAV